MVRAMLVSIATLALLGVTPAEAETPWRWPERAENLRVLPEDFPPDRLRAVMTGFTRALGVRCSHCHVGTEGEPLSSYDFPSDANPAKRVAREMYEMLGAINERLDEAPLGGETRVNMWCHTCHAGRARPATLVEELGAVDAAEGFAAAISRYDELRERYRGRGAYDFGESSLNEWGYALLEAGRVDDAIAAFALNARHFPSSANVWDSLGEAYAAAGKRQQAIVYYAKSLELDPGNTNAADRLAELRAD